MVADLSPLLVVGAQACKQIADGQQAAVEARQSMMSFRSSSPYTFTNVLLK
jgi:hypothetical protein